MATDANERTALQYHEFCEPRTQLPMSGEADPWELLYEKRRELFDKAASHKLSDSETAELIAALAEFNELTPPDNL